MQKYYNIKIIQIAILNTYQLKEKSNAYFADAKSQR